MTNVDVFFGHHCPKCRISIGVSAGVTQCPECRGPLQASPGGSAMKILGNFRCKYCSTVTGLLIDMGGQRLCPMCKSPV